MSHAAYADWLIKVGGGWLGYEPERVKDMLIEDILLCFEGKIDMLNRCFGGGKAEDKIEDVEDFDRVFG